VVAVLSGPLYHAVLTLSTKINFVFEGSRDEGRMPEDRLLKERVVSVRDACAILVFIRAIEF